MRRGDPSQHAAERKQQHKDVYSVQQQHKDVYSVQQQHGIGLVVTLLHATISSGSHANHAEPSDLLFFLFVRPSKMRG
jgi:hypothetical protein